MKKRKSDDNMDMEMGTRVVVLEVINVLGFLKVKGGV